MKDNTVAPGFLGLPPSLAATEAAYADDLASRGYVTNVSRLWSHAPKLRAAFDQLVDEAAELAGLDLRERGVVVVAMSAARGDSYCALAWGARLAEVAGDEVVVHVLHGDHDRLPLRERLLAGWARRVTIDPNATVAEDVDQLRAAGWDDDQVLALTTFTAARLAFSSVHDALGLPPDAALIDAVSAPIRDAVTYGRRATVGC